MAVADEYGDVLAVDMGAKWIAVSTFVSDRDTEFHGAEVRRVREHYKQLRRNIGKAKVRSGAQVIERLGDKESRTVEHELHQVANDLVARARERNAVIVFGDMTGLRFDTDEGRYVNDKIHKMPYAKMANILTYKAHLDGRECLPVNESDTSVTCWRCGSQNTSREVQGRVECHDCGLDHNADKNGATNIGKRAVGKTIQSPLSTVGAVVTQPGTQVVLKGINGEMEPANSPEEVGLSLSEGSPRLYSWEKSLDSRMNFGRSCGATRTDAKMSDPTRTNEYFIEILARVERQFKIEHDFRARKHLYRRSDCCRHAA